MAERPVRRRSFRSGGAMCARAGTLRGEAEKKKTKSLRVVSIYNLQIERGESAIE